MQRGPEIDSLDCPKGCGGRLCFLACVDPPLARTIPRHLGFDAAPLELLPARGPPDGWQLALDA